MPICPVHNVEHLPQEDGDLCWPGKHGKHVYEVYDVELVIGSAPVKLDPFPVELDDLANEAPGDSLQTEIADHIASRITSDYQIIGRMLPGDNMCVIYEDDSGTHNEIGRADVVYRGRKQ